MPSKSDQRVIDTSITIAAPPEAVWDALTTAEGLTNWFPLEAKVTPGEGGKIWSSWGPGMEGECRIEIWEPNTRLKVVYPQMNPSADRAEDHDPWAGDLAATEYILESKSPNETVLRLVHSGFSPDAIWDDLYDATKRGWAFELRGLRHYLERHPNESRRVARAMSVFDFSLEDAWAKLFGPDGLLGAAPPDKTEGARYTLSPAIGDPISGTVQIVSPPRACALVVEGWNAALLRLHFDEWRHPEPRRNAYLWISTYAMDESSHEALASPWQAAFADRFGAPPSPTGA